MRNPETTQDLRLKRYDFSRLQQVRSGVSNGLCSWGKETPWFWVVDKPWKTFRLLTDFSRNVICRMKASTHSNLSDRTGIWLIPGTVWYLESLLGYKEAHAFSTSLNTRTTWSQHTIRLFGKEVACPRLSAWHGDTAATYSYSGMTLAPEPWTPELQSLKNRVESATGTTFNSVLLNLYRDGSDSMGWHADDEPELGERPVIASVSLGAERRFRLKPRKDRHAGEAVSIDLADGSLLVMLGDCQSKWKHALPKTARPVGPRINLTFRSILPK